MTPHPQRILWVSNHTPFLVDFGGGQRSNLIYRALRSIGEVDVLLLCVPNLPGKTVQQTHGKGDGLIEIVQPSLRGTLGMWRVFRRFSPTLVDKLAHNLGKREMDYMPDPKIAPVLDKMLVTRKYNLIVGRHLKFPAKAGALRYTPTIIDVDDNELELYRLISEDRNTTMVRRMVLKRRVRSLERVMPKFLEKSTAIWVSKEEDRSMPGCERASVLPNIPFGMSATYPPLPAPPRSESKTILFVGMLSYIYNVEGVNSFLEEAWPIVRRAHPDATLRLVGSRLAESDRIRWSAVPGVQVAGFVDDLRESYQDAAFCVVPIWSGGGTNIKVLESLMYGRTCVIAQPAHKGYTRILRDNDSVLVGRTPTEMAQRCIELLSNPDRCASLAERGAKIVATAYSYDRFVGIVLETVEAVINTRLGVIRQ